MDNTRTIRPIVKKLSDENPFIQEIQFNSELGLIRIYPTKKFIEIISESILFLNKSNLLPSTYFSVIQDVAESYYLNNKVILVYAQHLESKTGVWFTIQTSNNLSLSSEVIVKSMTDKINELDIITNIMHTNDGTQFIHASLNLKFANGFTFWFFGS